MRTYAGKKPLSAEGEHVALSEIFEDNKSQRPDEQVEQQETIKDALTLISQLDHRDAKVIRLRYGLEGQDPLTLKEIGLVVGLTRERVRQIEIDSLKRLRDKMQEDKSLSKRKAS